MPQGSNEKKVTLVPRRGRISCGGEIELTATLDPEDAAKMVSIDGGGQHSQGLGDATLKFKSAAAHCGSVVTFTASAPSYVDASTTVKVLLPGETPVTVTVVVTVLWDEVRSGPVPAGRQSWADFGFDREQGGKPPTLIFQMRLGKNVVSISNVASRTDAESRDPDTASLTYKKDSASNRVSSLLEYRETVVGHDAEAASKTKIVWDEIWTQ